MDFSEIVMRRYAVKKFDGRKVPEERISRLLELVRFAPSALNLQPWRIKVVTDEETKRALRPAAFGQEQVTSCSHLLVFCADPDYESLIRRLSALLQAHHVPQDVQGAIISMAQQFTRDLSPEQRLAWSTAQTYLALSNAVNGAKSLELDSCPMGGFDPAGFTRILQIPAPLVPVMLCPVGYAADTQGPKMRFPLHDILL